MDAWVLAAIVCSATCDRSDLALSLTLANPQSEYSNHVRRELGGEAGDGKDLAVRTGLCRVDALEQASKVILSDLAKW
jgi:hypothetical protein